jgi:hypothetical protein
MRHQKYWNKSDACRVSLFTTLKLYTSLSYAYYLSNGAEDPMVIILIFKIRPNSNMPFFQGRLLSNQDQSLNLMVTVFTSLEDSHDIVAMSERPKSGQVQSSNGHFQAKPESENQTYFLVFKWRIS